MFIPRTLSGVALVLTTACINDVPPADTSIFGGTAGTGGPATGATGSDPDDGDGPGDSSSIEPSDSDPRFDVGTELDLGAGEGIACSTDLKQVLDPVTGEVLETCPPDQGCLDGQCAPACDAAAAAAGSLGCDFLVPTSPFFNNETPGASQAGPCHALLVSNPWDQPATLELAYDDETYDVPTVARIPRGIASDTVYDPLPDGRIPPGQVAVVFLSHRPGVRNSSSLECPIRPAVRADTAIHGTDRGVAFAVRSDTPVQLYDMLPYGGASSALPSASLLYPSPAWGRDYLATTPHPQTGIEWLLAVARDDDTTVSIAPSVAMTPGAITDPPPGVVTEYTLDAGEVLQWTTSIVDPVGSIITADRPIGVFTGNTYLIVDTADNPASGGDAAHQMIPHVNALGSEYVGAGLYSRRADRAPESVLYRAVGVVDGTALVWDPAPPPGAPAALDAAEAVEFESTEGFSVRAQDDEHPFSLSQYMGGSLYEQTGCSDIAGVCSLGDDDWIVLLPPAQFLRAYPFFVDPTYATTTLVFVREAGDAGFADVELDCMGTVGGWQPVGDAGVYEYARVELFRGGEGMVPACETSQHLARSEGDFGVMVWGTDRFASYGYPAGGYLRPINEIAIDPAG